MIPDDCIDFDDSRPIAVAKQNGKVFRLVNNNGRRLRSVRVDCLIPVIQGQGRCDNLLVIDNFEAIHLIELKGGDLQKGIKQIDNTFEFVFSLLQTGQFWGYLVGAKSVPNLKNTSEYVRIKKKLYKTGGDFIYFTNRKGEKII